MEELTSNLAWEDRFPCSPFQYMAAVSLQHRPTGDPTALDDLYEDERHALELLEDYFRGVPMLNLVLAQLVE